MLYHTRVKANQHHYNITKLQAVMKYAFRRIPYLHYNVYFPQLQKSFTVNGCFHTGYLSKTQVFLSKKSSVNTPEKVLYVTLLSKLVIIAVMWCRWSMKLQ